jgi:hypothetical protein
VGLSAGDGEKPGVWGSWVERSEGTNKAKPTAGTPSENFRGEREVLWLGALGGCGGLRLSVDEVGGVVAACFAAIDASTITCFGIMLYDAAFAASAVGLA